MDTTEIEYLYDAQCRAYILDLEQRDAIDDTIEARESLLADLIVRLYGGNNG
jgi:hypothetical protein